MSVGSLTGKQELSEPRCMDDAGFGFGARSEIKGEREEHSEDGGERGAFPGGTVEARVDVSGRLVACELGVRRHGGGRGLNWTGHEL